MCENRYLPHSIYKIITCDLSNTFQFHFYINTNVLCVEIDQLVLNKHGIRHLIDNSVRHKIKNQTSTTSTTGRKVVQWLYFNTEATEIVRVWKNKIFACGGDIIKFIFDDLFFLFVSILLQQFIPLVIANTLRYK